jgi:hypothetical protein
MPSALFFLDKKKIKGIEEKSELKKAHLTPVEK